jgi:hypothetical protein
MKSTCVILLAGLLLCGCSQKQSGPIIDQIQPGKDLSWDNGPVLRITKRDGNSLEGVTVTAKLPNGQTQILSAATATLAPAPNTTNGVIVTLHSATTQVGSESPVVVGELPIGIGK